MEIKTEIKPAHVTPEQAKLFKDKGFDVLCRNYYLDKDSNIHEGFDDDYWGDNRLKNWNADVIGIKPFKGFISAPEQWQAVEWLRVKHGIWISVLECNDKSGYYWRLLDEAGPSNLTFVSPQEAYSAAFDYVLNNLIKNTK